MAKKIIPFMPHGDASLFDDIVIEELIKPMESDSDVKLDKFEMVYEKKSI